MRSLIYVPDTMTMTDVYDLIEDMRGTSADMARLAFMAHTIGVRDTKNQAEESSNG